MNDAQRTRRIIGGTNLYRVIAVGAALIVLLVWVASGWDAWRARRFTLADNDREMSSLANAIAEQSARSLQEVDLILRRTAVWEREAKTQTIGPEDETAFLRRQIEGLPQIRELTITDTNGMRIASTMVLSKSDPDISGRRYFQELRNASGNALVISEPLESLLGRRPTFAMAIRLQDADGNFAGVARALVEEDYFRDFYRRTDLGPGASIELLRDGGIPIVQYPAAEPGRASEEVRTVVKPVPGFALEVQVSRDQSVALADWRTTSINAFVRTALISAFVALLAYALIRQMRRLEEVNVRLRTSERRWRAVFENAPLGIVVLTGEGACQATNPAFQRMVGYSAADLARLNAFDLIHDEDVQSTREHANQLFSGALDKIRFQVRYLHRDGQIVWTDVGMARVAGDQAPLAVGARLPAGMLVVTVEDITLRREAERERRRLESQLRQSQKLEALGTFAGGIAHDFNNILGAILGYGERAFRALPAASEVRSYVEHVLNAGNRARTLVERILTFSRSGMTVRVPVRVQPVVMETLDLLKVRLPESIDLAASLEAADAYVAGDATHIHQVVMNLCSNAVLAMPGGGKLTVVLERTHLPVATTLSNGVVGPGECLRLTVADTGTGIAPDMLERIFNPFFTTRKTGEGTGLGLSLVDGIVREYGGGIHIASVVGEGTQFDVYLPVTDAPPPATDEMPKSLPRGDGQVVLIVDDEPVLVSLAEDVLAELGYEPVGYGSSLAALAAFEAAPARFDAVLTDQTMPDLTGLELTARIRAIQPSLPVILCSGYGNAALEREAREVGAVALLCKPLRAEDLALALHRALHRLTQ
ncbi:ATP-binding protein [Paraburkholderia sp. J12]|uniref:ATP-binding protein n=1 Tax=Paraburkholderia sp. J12 TaxID=2805432 RepID=UPI002ABE5CD4|nr:ATP-binding protein [Paraburkholderia sp. J12]